MEKDIEKHRIYSNYVVEVIIYKRKIIVDEVYIEVVLLKDKIFI